MTFPDSPKSFESNIVCFDRNLELEFSIRLKGTAILDFVVEPAVVFLDSRNDSVKEFTITTTDSVSTLGEVSIESDGIEIIEQTAVSDKSKRVHVLVKKNSSRDKERVVYVTHSLGNVAASFQIVSTDIVKCVPRMVVFKKVLHGYEAKISLSGQIVSDCFQDTSRVVATAVKLQNSFELRSTVERRSNSFICVLSLEDVEETTQRSFTERSETQVVRFSDSEGRAEFEVPFVVMSAP